MNLFVSLAGLQPAATAVGLKTFACSVSIPDRVLLLATPRVVKLKVAERLEAYFRAELKIEAVTVRPIGDRLDGTGDLPDAATAVADDLAQSGVPPQDVIFDIEPGLRALSIAIIRQLGPSATFLSSDMRDMIVQQPSGTRRVPLVDLGLRALLALYGLCADLVPASGLFRRLCPRSSAVHTGLQFQELPAVGRPPSIDLAYERHGYLFGLKAIERADDSAHRAAAGLEQVRQLAACRDHLAGLKPVFGMLSNDPGLRVHARSLRLVAVTPDRTRRWLERRVVVPGAHSYLTERRDDRPETPPVDAHGSGGDGPPLVTWIGPDPSATLVCLHSTTPRLAWILYDRTTTGSIEAARRLGRSAPVLPVGDLRFIASDLVGDAVRAALEADPDFCAARSDVIANVSPGRTAQAAALAHLDGVKLFSLDKGANLVRPLTTGEGAHPMEAPAFLTQAAMCGGRLRNPALVRDLGEPPWDMFLALAQFERDAAAEGLRVPVLQSTRLVSGHSLTRTTKSIRIDLGGKPVSSRSRRVLSSLASGTWFEYVVAAAFKAAGADEVYANVKWHWAVDRAEARDPSRADEHRVEFDVGVRVGGALFAISCKAGKVAPTRKTAREIEAVAAQCLGRFAIPVVCRPKLSEALLSCGGPGAAFLDVTLLGDPDGLRTWMRDVVSGRLRMGAV